MSDLSIGESLKTSTPLIHRDLAKSAAQSPVIVVDGLHFSYPSGQEALRGIDLRVYSGERVAVVGPNGAGKSTLLLHLNGLLRGKGRLVVSDLPVTEKNLRVIRQRVGLVFQDPDDQLFSPTVFDDVAFGLLNLGLPGEEVRRRTQEALRQVGLAGYEGRSPHHLSLGEKKRAAMATVLAQGPRILVLDEPSSNLDPKARRRLINLLAGLEVTEVIATHDLEMARDLCPRMVIVNQGRIVADGETSLLLADQRLLEENDLEPPCLGRLVSQLPL